MLRQWFFRFLRGFLHASQGNIGNIFNPAMGKGIIAEPGANYQR